MSVTKNKSGIKYNNADNFKASIKSWVSLKTEDTGWYAFSIDAIIDA